MQDVPHFAMLTTFGAEDGELRSRPMTLQEVEFDGDLWFFCDKSTSPAVDIQTNSNVNLSFSDTQKNTYVSATGRTQVIVDPAKAKELWNPMYKAWFPRSLEDPNLCLIQVKVERADYWESPSSKVATLFGFAKAIATGEKAGPSVGRHVHLN